jgi:hypothetical protein
MQTVVTKIFATWGRETGEAYTIEVVTPFARNGVKRIPQLMTDSGLTVPKLPDATHQVDSKRWIILVPEGPEAF